MSLVFTFLSATNQAKDLTLNGACDFQTKSMGNNGVGLIWLDKTEKNDFIMNKPEEDKDQAPKSWANGDSASVKERTWVFQDLKDYDGSLDSKRKN